MSSAKKWLRWGGALALLGIFAALLDWEKLEAHISQDTILGALAAQSALFCGIAITALRHSMLVARPPAPFRATLVAVTLAQGLSFIVPGRLPEFLKATYLRQTCNIPLGAGMMAILLERMMDLLVIGLIAAVALPVSGLGGSWLLIPTGLIAVPVLFLLGARLQKQFLLKIAQRLPGQRLKEFAKIAIMHFAEKLRRRDYLLSFLAGLPLWSMFLLSNIILFEIWDIPGLSLKIIVAVYVASVLGATIPLLPGGVGTVEGAAVFVLLQFGFPAEQGLAMALGMRLTQVLFLLPLSLILLAVVRTGLSDLWSQFRSSADTDRQAPDQA